MKISQKSIDLIRPLVDGKERTCRELHELTELPYNKIYNALWRLSREGVLAKHTVAGSGQHPSIYFSLTRAGRKAIGGSSE